MDYKKEAIIRHEQWQGKIEVISRVELLNRDDLSVAYTPGVAEPCIEINKNPDLSYKYTRRGNLVAVVTDGSAVLGLGNIGASAGMPVMEGKCVLFKKFGNVDAFPIALNTQDTEEIIRTVANIAPSFGGINLEDIAAPRCFEIERRLSEMLDIPVFHDDQHGTAVVVLGALLNSLKLANKCMEDCRIIISGAGAAGAAIAKLLLSCNAGDVILCNRSGLVYEGKSGLNSEMEELSKITNRQLVKGSLADGMKGADVFIGVSAPGIVTSDMVKSMADKSIVFALANPVPEIYPDEASKAGAFIVGSGRSDYPNQVNNVLAFPGIFRGALDCRASKISENMKIAAAYALAELVGKDLSVDKVLPLALDEGVGELVAKRVKEAAIKDKLNRI